jgi:LmbE family N-acetylglucosaminyl deacetylase
MKLAGLMRRPQAVVVAHPDDEALWLSSVIGSVERVAFCFGALFDRPRLSAARRRAVAALPLTGVVDLAVPESGAGHSIDSARSEPTATGIEIADAAARRRYEANYARLVDTLRTALTGFGDVYTHNPWGEYGHPEHIQVHRAVVALQSELGFTIWFSNYVGSASWPLALRLGGRLEWAQRRVLPPDLATARKLMRVYRQYGAWTWSRAHRWPALETLYAQPPPGAVQAPAPEAQPSAGNPGARCRNSGEWLWDVKRLRWWPLPRRFALRRLPSQPSRPPTPAEPEA